MRDKVAEIISDVRFENTYGDTETITDLDLADLILAFIDSQRCEWTRDEVAKPEAYFPSCRDGISFGSKWDFPFCPCCGRRVSIEEVKDGQG